ncbi:MAG: hypothetical protein KGS72_16875 [Cyanobacteria bacterium REEB67]|nr:hypothetical protein [Cyanobacteria bacterium REEB67]
MVRNSILACTLALYALMPTAVFAASDSAGGDGAGPVSSAAGSSSSSSSGSSGQSNLFSPSLEPSASSLTGSVSLSTKFRDIDKLTDDIILKEIELYRINTNFRLENNKSAPGRRVRMLVYQNINYGCTFAGLMINVIYNFQWYRRLPFHTSAKFVPKNVLAAVEHIPSQQIPVGTQFLATMPRLVGKFILINGVLVETAIAMKQKHKEKKEGFDVKATDARVLALSREIEAMLAHRGELIMISPLTGNERKVALADSAALSQARNLSLQEYAKLHANSIGASTYNRVDTPLTLLKKSDGDFGADVVRLISAGNHDGALSPIASISTTISGAMSAWDPVVELAARGAARAISNRRERRRLGISEKDAMPAFQESLKNYVSLENLVDNANEPVLASIVQRRSELFQSFGTAYNSMDFVNNRATEEQRKHDKHSLIIHQIYGTSKYARGAWLIYVGNRYAYYPRHNTFLTGCAGISNFTGSAIRMADTLHTDVIEIFRQHQLQSRRSVSAVILNGRLNTLNEMQETLGVQASAPPRSPVKQPVVQHGITD